MEFNRLDLKRVNRALIVTIQTGHKGNAFCLDTMEELTRVAQAVAEDTQTSTVILTGQTSVFTVGMNLADPRITQPETFDLEERRRGARLGGKMCQAWESIEAITISAIEGACVGAGVALSLALDFRVCAEDSFLYVPEIERGMNMGWQSVPRSVNLIGPAKTKRMFILAEKISAENALQWGWTDYLSKSGEAINTALEIAARIEQLPPIPVRMCKQAINSAANALNQAVSYMDADQLLVTQQGDDYKEGITSYLEKRPPDYKGK